MFVGKLNQYFLLLEMRSFQNQLICWKILKILFFTKCACFGDHPWGTK